MKPDTRSTSASASTIPCCEPLDSALRHQRYALVFDGPGAAIFAVRPLADRNLW